MTTGNGDQAAGFGSVSLPRKISGGVVILVGIIFIVVAEPRWYCRTTRSSLPGLAFDRLIFQLDYHGGRLPIGCHWCVELVKL